MPGTLPSIPIFPSWCILGVKSRDEFSTDLTLSRGAEVTNPNWSESRWVITLSGGKCTDEQNRQLKAFNRWSMGRRRLFLYRRYLDPEWELQDEVLGVGDGVRTDFQAGLSDEVPGVEDRIFKAVYALDHNIPEIGLTAYDKPATQTRKVEVYVDGVLQTSGITVFRETGVIRFAVAPAAGCVVTIRGGFFARVRLNQEYIETEPNGAGWHIVSDGVQLIEPKGLILTGGGGGQ